MNSPKTAKTNNISSLSAYFVKSYANRFISSSPRNKESTSNTNFSGYLPGKEMFRVDSHYGNKCEKQDILSNTIDSFAKYRLKTLQTSYKFKSRKSNPHSIGELCPSAKENNIESKIVIKRNEVNNPKLVGLSFDKDFGQMKKWKVEIKKDIKTMKWEGSIDTLTENPTMNSPDKSSKDVKISTRSERVNTSPKKRASSNPFKIKAQAKVPKFVKEQVFKDLDYKAAISNLRSANLNNTMCEFNEVMSSPQKTNQVISPFEFEAPAEDSHHEVFTKNKYKIEEDVQFLELAKKLDTYIKSKPTLISPRKKQLESQMKKPEQSSVEFRRLMKQMTLESIVPEISDGELKKVLLIYEQKPFHDRKKLQPDALVFMKRLVENIPFFKPFSSKVIENLLHTATAIKLKEGSIVYSEEEIVGHMFVILKGRVEIYKKDISDFISHRFEIGDSTSSKVMPLLIGDNSSLFANASSNYVGLLNFGGSEGKATKVLVSYIHPASKRSWIRIQLW